MGSINIVTPYMKIGQYLSFRNRDHFSWWHQKGPVLSQMLQACHYGVHEQYQYLTLFYAHLIPALGAYTEPSVGQKGNTLLSGAGRLELSRTFTVDDSSLRIAFEPTSFLASEKGTDPLNRVPLSRLLSVLGQLSGVSLGTDRYRTLADQLTTSDDDEEKLLNEPTLAEQLQSLPSRTQNILALELVNGFVKPELYFHPQMKALASGALVEDLLFDALRSVDSAGRLGKAIDLAKEFVQAAPTTTRPQFISYQIERSHSGAAKLFLTESAINWDQISGLWRYAQPETIQTEQNRALRVLWESLNVVEGNRGPNQFPIMMVLGLFAEEPFVRPQVAFPVVGMTEGAIARSIGRFFDNMGWKESSQSYVDGLRSYFPNEDLDQPLGKQAWVALSLFDSENPALTVFYY
uniref:Prenyltransferase phqA n=1 Tax=Penicillium fellutanum TaxID=70095 RepID=PHQA_PENFE|nr:RecName: Full=Prenyltransferase phqA; AltName: Full=Paraherquamide biosynthesis cluster protein A [Penicillium fellutanum]AGA37268.1 prenyltransferase [Penicillium fellutanum]